MKLLKQLVNTVKVILLAIRIKRGGPGTLIRTTLTVEQAGLASMRAGRFTMIYNTNNGTELQILN